jgi:ribosomal protein S18 acetylase RimI-like enzyme
MAAPEDSERIAELDRELSLHHASCHPIYSLKETTSEAAVAHIREKIEKTKSGDTLALVAQDRSIVGFLTCSVIDRNNPNWQTSKIGHIGGVYVNPAYRCQGVASALMEEAFKWLRERKIEYVDLNVVVQNTEAIAAYTALGFKPLQHNLIKKL